MSTNDAALREAFEAAGQGDDFAWAGRNLEGGQQLDTTIVMVHRFTGGKVTGGADVCPAPCEEFWRKTGITG